MIVSSFNLGHGAADIEPEKVRLARADWARWWQAVDEFSRRRSPAGRSLHGVTVADILLLAGVPTSPNLRATRLGLVWLVRHNLGKSVAIPAGWPAALPPNARWNHPIDIEPYRQPKRRSDERPGMGRRPTRRESLRAR